MKTIKKNVYYCDFCNKHGLAAGHIKSHESHCTMNPNRTCRMCGNHGVDMNKVSLLQERYKLYKKDREEADVLTDNIVPFKDRIKDIISVNDCPACTLAIFRLSGISPYDIDYDYKTEAEKYLKNQQHIAEDNY